MKPGFIAAVLAVSWLSSSCERAKHTYEGPYVLGQTGLQVHLVGEDSEFYYVSVNDITGCQKGDPYSWTSFTIDGKLMRVIETGSLVLTDSNVWGLREVSKGQIEPTLTKIALSSGYGDDIRHDQCCPAMFLELTGTVIESYLAVSSYQLPKHEQQQITVTSLRVGGSPFKQVNRCECKLTSVNNVIGVPKGKKAYLIGSRAVSAVIAVSQTTDERSLRAWLVWTP